MRIKVQSDATQLAAQISFLSNVELLGFLFFFDILTLLWC